MTLKAHILQRIRAAGPMRIDDYMATCLLHPEAGYYTTRMPFGSSGDFTTAPEISQMFGELLGLCLAQKWRDDGAPSPFTLAELGPGRGTLIADALRACAAVPGFTDAAQLYLVEASPALRAVQSEALADHAPTFVRGVENLPQQPLYLIANEFFDALPVRQFVRDGKKWRERQVGAQDDDLVFGLGPAQPQPALAARLLDTADGDLVEVCSALAPTITDIGSRIDRHGGGALIIDYGDWRTQGDTLQAVHSHEPTHPLDDPGAADLTAHVDFEAIASAAAPCVHSRLTPQGIFLERLGITARAQRLAAALGDAALDSHIAAHRRLTHPDEMGNLFKVIALFQKGSSPPPGLDS